MTNPHEFNKGIVDSCSVWKPKATTRAEIVEEE